MILRLASQQTGALRPPARAHLSSELVGSLADLPKIDPTTREMRFGVSNTVTKLGTLTGDRTSAEDIRTRGHGPVIRRRECRLEGTAMWRVRFGRGRAPRAFGVAVPLVMLSR